MAQRNHRAVMVLGLAVLAACGRETVTPDLGRFDELSRRSIERARAALARTEDFNQTDALRALPPGPYHVRSLRFIEAAEDARFLPARPLSGEAASVDHVAPQWSWSPQEDSPAEDDRFVLNLEAVSSAAVGALRLRAVVPTGSHARLRVELSSAVETGAIAVRLDLAADGEEHDYIVDLRAALDRWRGAPIETLMIDWERGAPGHLGSVELLGRTWKYSERWGMGAERVGGDTRPVVYVAGEGALSWELDGSWRDARLRFSLAEVVPGRRSHVRLVLGRRGRQQQLAEFDLEGGEDWREVEIALGAIELTGARLTLSVDATDGDAVERGVVLFGSPVLWEPPVRRFNVLVLLEDALRADRMSVYGHHRQTTPFKERIFADGVRFERCIAQSTKTRFSCPSFMTSLRPFATGVWGIWNRNVRLDEGYVTLAEVLASQGWATASFLQNGNAGPDNGLDQGFERVVENIPGRADAVYGGEALAWIRSVKERNFFGNLHVADPHAPYDPPEAQRRWHDAIMIDSGGPRWSDPVWLTGVRRALYDGEVASNDLALRRLIDELDTLGLLDDTLIVLIADHGEHLGEHDLWDHIPPSYLQVIRVPMLWRYPRRLDGARVVRQPVQNLDLMPTILDLAGIETSGLPLQGRSLVPLLTGDETMLSPELAVVQEAMLYTRTGDPRLHGSLIWDEWHSLRSPRVGHVLFDHVRDPDEEQPMAPSSDFDRRAGDLLRELRWMDEELHGQLRGSPLEVVEVDLDTIHNLEALGYLDE